MSENTNGAAKAPKAIIEPVDPVEEPVEAATAEGTSQQDSSQVSDKKTTGRFQDATVGFFEGVGRAAWAYADAHPHATLYGIIGFVLAVLVLVIGLWDTIVIAVFVAVGTIIGQMVDGDNAVVNFLSRVINGRR